MSTRVPNEVLIRMYDVGFGDSFFLRFPSPDRKRHLKVLIDCGTFAKGRNDLPDVVKSIVASAREDDDKPRLDVVIATHRHKDHVDGFRYADWAEVAVKEVWMPWTEEPDAEDARTLRLAQERAVARLVRALDTRREFSGAAPDILALALKNEAAMHTLWSGFAGEAKRRYLPPQDRVPFTFRSDALPGVAVHVLGPSRDKAVIRNLEPPDEQSYLWAAAVAGESSGTGPFSREVPTYTPLQFGRRGDARHLALAQDVQKAVDRASEPIDPLAIAAQMDAAINGTSLMLVFEIGKATLLFPGDAQWGTWQTVLRDPTCRELVEQANFYKVSHHASHNGTPVDFVHDVLKRNARAMVSVRPYANWPDIPRGPLLTALEEKCGEHVVRSDKARKSAEDEWYTVGEDEFATYVETRIKC